MRQLKWLSLAFALGTIWGQDFGARFGEIRDGASARELYRFLYAMPKGGDLHHHAGLALLADTLWEKGLAAEKDGYRYYTRVAVSPCNPALNGPFLLYETIGGGAYAALDACQKKDYKALADLSGAEREAWKSALILDQPGEGMNEFFEEIVARQLALVRNPYLFADAFAENLKLFAAEGVRYVEAQWFPFGMQKPDGTRMDPEEALRIFRQRMAQADVAGLKTQYRFQTTIIRFRDDVEQQVGVQYEWVDRHRDLWVGVNMAGREDNDKGYALRVLEALRRARRQYAGIRLSFHAGEKSSPGREVRDTLLLGAERIGHGINLISDPDTMLLMRNGRNLVEINLVSNRLLEYVKDLKQHPLVEYLRFGIPVCLNTDDRGSWDSNMTDEYFHAVKEFRLTWDEVKALGRMSLEHSFAPAEMKAKMLADYEREMTAFEAKWARGDWREALAGMTAAESGYARRNLLAKP